MLVILLSSAVVDQVKHGRIKKNTNVKKDFYDGALLYLFYFTSNAIFHPQIDFGSLKKITRVATVGGYTEDEREAYNFISKFKLEYSNDSNSVTWEKYRENEEIKVSTYVRSLPVATECSLTCIRSVFVRLPQVSF